MSYTNSTPNYELPQWIGTDKPTFLGDFNSAFSAIDTAMKNNADASSAATSTANAAQATATSANTNANTAISTANNAKDTADAATTAAASATSTANNAKNTADAAATAALGNNIANLAPAYDPTLTYQVGDLVTYVDSQNTGKLYKCIVAVNSPMAFNVNYWDDVTTSEVYNRKMTIATVAGTTTDTYKDILDRLTDDANFAGADSNILLSAYIELWYASNRVQLFKVVDIDPDQHVIVATRPFGSQSAFGISYFRIANNASYKSNNLWVSDSVSASGFATENNTPVNPSSNVTIKVVSYK